MGDPQQTESGNTGRDGTECGVAVILASFASVVGESPANGDAYDYWHEYDPTRRRFLGAAHGRFRLLLPVIQRLSSSPSR